MSPPDDEMDVPAPRIIPPPIDPKLGWWYKWWRSITATAAAALVTAASVGIWTPPYAAIVVNMIPAQIALEELPNPEPSIAVNPANPNEIAAGGILEGMARGCGKTSFGITYSQDRGETWTLHCSLELGAEYMAGDPSFAYTSDGSTLLVAAQAAYHDGSNKLLLRIFATHSDATAITWPVTDLIPPNDVSLDSSHVPWIATSTNPTTPLVAIGGDSYRTMGANCHSGVVWWNYPTPTSYAPVCVSPRAAPYTPVVRTVVHNDGTAYAATYRLIQYTGPGGHANGAKMDVVVFRHDPTEPSGGPADPFSGLKETVSTGGSACDRKDGLRGVRVVRCVWVPFESLNTLPAAGFGFERRLFSHVAIAVDPSTSKHVFVAWGDADSSADGMTLHVRESTDGGETWSSADLLKVSRAINPALAVSTSGHLGFSYQQLVSRTDGDHWETTMRVYDGSDVAFGPIMTFPLATMRAGNPGQCGMPYLGDYMDLKTINGDFYGVFSSTSDMSGSNFPVGVKYARTPTVAQLARCPDSTAQPETSIDPYFFRIDRHWFSARQSRFARSIVDELKHPFSSIFK